MERNNECTTNMMMIQQTTPVSNVDKACCIRAHVRETRVISVVNIFISVLVTVLAKFSAAVVVIIMKTAVIVM